VLRGFFTSLRGKRILTMMEFEEGSPLSVGDLRMSGSCGGLGSPRENVRP
jgi:hypothetical protein